MKRFLLFAVVGTVLLSSCDGGKAKLSASSSDLDSVSYAIGVYEGGGIKQKLGGAKLEVNDAMFLAGLRDALSKDSSAAKMTQEQTMSVINNYFTKRQENQKIANLKKGSEFLAKNAKEPGVTSTASGLQYKIISEGSGLTPTATDTVEVHYTGTLIDGTKFDSSVDHDQAVKFPVNAVIKGWTEGLQLMKEGDKYILYVPSELAYGENPAGPTIEANSTLIFEVELIKVYPAKK